MEKIVVYEQVEATFGQTGAGCHTATAAPTVLAVADRGSSWEEQDRVMEAARPVVVLALGSWAGSVELAVQSFEDLERLLRVRTRDSGWYIRCSGPYSGMRRVRLMDPAEIQALQSVRLFPVPASAGMILALTRIDDPRCPQYASAGRTRPCRPPPAPAGSRAGRTPARHPAVHAPA